MSLTACPSSATLCEPVGYFVTAGIVGTSGRYSDFGRDNWLKGSRRYAHDGHSDLDDLQLLLSRDGPLLRLVILPFLLLFGLGIFVVLGGLLEALGILDFNPLLDNPLTNSLGKPGKP